MEKGGFWINKAPYQNYKQIREEGYGRPDGRVRMFIDEFSKVDHSPLPLWAPRWQEPDDQYKFSLLITRAPWYMHADPNFINNPVLKQITLRNHMDSVWISPTRGNQARPQGRRRSHCREQPEVHEGIAAASQSQGAPVQAHHA